jgi:hypothetical protein
MTTFADALAASLVSSLPIVEEDYTPTTVFGGAYPPSDEAREACERAQIYRAALHLLTDQWYREGCPSGAYLRRPIGRHAIEEHGVDSRGNRTIDILLEIVLPVCAAMEATDAQ